MSKFSQLETMSFTMKTAVFAIYNGVWRNLAPWIRTHTPEEKTLYGETKHDLSCQLHNYTHNFFRSFIKILKVQWRQLLRGAGILAG